MKRKEVEQLRERVEQLSLELERCHQAAYAHEINALLRLQLERALEKIEEVSEERDKLQDELWTYAGNVAPIERGLPEPMRYRVVVRGKKNDI
jgi:predicted translin family RNA/ssDNA-binding protein